MHDDVGAVRVQVSEDIHVEILDPETWTHPVGVHDTREGHEATILLTTHEALDVAKALMRELGVKITIDPGQVAGVFPSVRPHADSIGPPKENA